MPLAYQSSSRFSSDERTTTTVGMPSSSPLRIAHRDPCPPVLNGQRPFNVKPPSVGNSVPVGDSTPLIRGSPSPSTSSCASSLNVPNHQPIALRIVETHDVDGQPRATSASTSHCVSKSSCSPPYFFGAHILRMPASASASNVSSGRRRACSDALACSRKYGTSAFVRSSTESEDMNGSESEDMNGSSRLSRLRPRSDRARSANVPPAPDPTVTKPGATVAVMVSLDEFAR